MLVGPAVGQLHRGFDCGVGDSDVGRHDERQRGTEDRVPHGVPLGRRARERHRRVRHEDVVEHHGVRAGGSESERVPRALDANALGTQRDRAVDHLRVGVVVVDARHEEVADLAAACRRLAGADPEAAVDLRGRAARRDPVGRARRDRDRAARRPCEGTASASMPWWWRHTWAATRCECIESVTATAGSPAPSTRRISPISACVAPAPPNSGGTSAAVTPVARSRSKAATSSSPVRSKSGAVVCRSEAMLATSSNSTAARGNGGGCISRCRHGSTVRMTRPRERVLRLDPAGLFSVPTTAT